MLTKLRLFLLYSFPVVLFCSYYPLIPITSTASTNYELSLPLIWLFLFALLSLRDFLAAIYNIYRQKPLYLLALLFPFYLTLTALWSTNPLRAILTSGILWCIIVTGVVIFTTFRRQKLLDSRRFLRIFFCASGIFCILCWLQSILDVFGVARATTLLCSGCTSRMFGFPHPSGLAIEPQFMGNLLLAPTLTALYLWTKPQHDTNRTKSQLQKPKNFVKYITARIISDKYAWLSFFFVSTLFLAFSRGAIYAFALGFIFLLALSLIKLKNRRLLKTLPLLAISAIFIILIQGLFSALSYTDSTFLGGIEKSISQMTLGKVNLTLEQQPAPSASGQPTSATAPATTSGAPVFDGYVEESTNARLNFNRITLELAPKNATTLLFGYGLGSAGEIMHQAGKTTTPYEIVQNEYLSLLLETGLTGLILATLSLIVLFLLLKKINCPEHLLLEAIIISFLFSLLFFSGLPNALHLYLFPVFLAATLPSRPPKPSRKLPAPRA